MRTAHVGFRTEGFAPFTYLFQEIARNKYELDLQPAAQFNREAAEANLVGGGVDFLLGQHYTPVLATVTGEYRLSWFAVAQVEDHYKMITRPEIQAPEELVGRTCLLPEARCPALNAMLVLRKMGLEDKVKYLNSAERSAPPRDPVTGAPLHSQAYFLNEVKEGRADFTMGYPPMDIRAQRMGLRVFDTPTLDVCYGPLITATPEFAYRDPEMTKDLLRAYSEAIYVFKTDKEIVLDVLLREKERLLAYGFDINDKEMIDVWYERRAEVLQPRPYPTPAAIEWTEYKAGIDYPQVLAGGVNALRTVDTHFLQELDREGFFDSLWKGGGRP